MKPSDLPAVKDLVLVGGGHSHVSVLKSFAMKPIPGVRLTLICKDMQAPYSGMLPGLLAGHYTFDDAHIDLGPLARFAGARLLHDKAIGLDGDNKQVICEGRPPVSYDLLAINIGSTPADQGISGVRDHALAVKPIDRFLQRWAAIRARMRQTTGPVTIAVVGGGAGGVELLLSVRHQLAGELQDQGGDPARLQFHLVTAADSVLPSHNKRVQAAFQRVLAERGVAVHAGERVVGVEANQLTCASGLEIKTDHILWTTEASAQAWPAEAGLATDEKGFIRVADTLQSVSHPGIFASGDIAAVDGHPRPKSGVFAVRQGPPLSENLRRSLLGQTLKPFRPQRQFLSLISTGDTYAVASKGGWALQGPWVWRWKDWIDRRFMDKFNTLPEMASPDGTADVPAGLADAATLRNLGDDMRCGGCGAKIGPDVLKRVLQSINRNEQTGILIGLDEPDDAAVLEIPPGKVLVNTVDGFRAFIDDPYVFGRIAANHALNDLYAMGADPHSALVLVTLPHGLAEKTEHELTQLMAGALSMLGPAGARLVGGHTGEGAETALGFALNGIADPSHILRKGGLRPGNVLILTKPLGTGVLFAADMRGRAKGRWIEGALAVMQQSNDAAVGILRRHTVTACTDISGFGLLGHLTEMLEASGASADIKLAALPVLDGAGELSKQGIASSLTPQNETQKRSLRNGEAAAKEALYPLLFDPQTAGGLLAGVPADAAQACLDELRSKGYAEAAVIGTVNEPGGNQAPVTISA